MVSCPSATFVGHNPPLIPRTGFEVPYMQVVLFVKGNNARQPMKASFLRKRKMTRAVLVLDAGLAGLGPYLRSKNFHVITMPADARDTETKTLFLCHRTLITRTPQEFEYDVPVLEYSVIDVSGATSDDPALADIISLAWTKLRLKSEGWFILRLRQDGDHKIQFPE